MTSNCKTYCAKTSQSLECYMHCVVLVTFVRERKEEKPLFKQILKVTFCIITSFNMMLCLACQLLFLTGYYFTIYVKQNTLPAGRWNTISDGVTQMSLFRVQQRKQETSARRQSENWNHNIQAGLEINGNLLTNGQQFPTFGY